MVSSFRIKDGHIDFKQRYVDTEKLKVEKTVRRSLLGKDGLLVMDQFYTGG